MPRQEVPDSISNIPEDRFTIMSASPKATLPIEMKDDAENEALWNKTYELFSRHMKLLESELKLLDYRLELW